LVHEAFKIAPTGWLNGDIETTPSSTLLADAGLVMVIVGYVSGSEATMSTCFDVGPEGAVVGRTNPSRVTHSIDTSVLPITLFIVFPVDGTSTVCLVPDESIHDALKIAPTTDDSSNALIET
jgi:hypothetical protein